MKTIYKVTITRDGTEHYYTSLAAIYTELTPEQIGCKVGNLWNYGIRADRPFSNSRCLIEKVTVMNKPQKR